VTEQNNRIEVKSKCENSYGDKYREHILEQYKLYVEMADRVSSRRQTANAFFLSINTALIAVAGFTKAENEILPKALMLVVPIAGVLLSIAWYAIIKSHKDQNSAKIKINHEIENELPLKPYVAEWSIAGEGKDYKRYLPFTHIEPIIPWTFCALYLLIFIYVLVTKI
jgi:hypothetical protein